MLAKYDTSFCTKDQKVHSDLHHDSNSELTWISKIKRTNSMIIFKKHVFLLVVMLWELFLCPDWDRVAIRILE